MSESVVLAHVEDMVVPVVTGLPAGRTYVPEPLRAIYCSLWYNLIMDYIDFLWIKLIVVTVVCFVIGFIIEL
jgi:hypothetical protein